MRVDVHSHLVPIACLAEMQRLDGSEAPRLVADSATGRRVLHVGRRRIGSFDDHLFDPRRRLQASEVDVHVLSLPPFLLRYELTPELGAAFARLWNDALAEVVRADPARFAALATLPMQTPALAERELQRVADLGFRGVEIGTNVAGRNLDDPDLEPVWASAERLGTFVFMHPEQVAGADRLQKYAFVNLLGNPLDTTIAVGSLVFGGVLARHPGLRVCAAHGGGFAPYQMGRFDRGWRMRQDARGEIQEPPSSYLRRVYFDTILHNRGALAYLVQTVGPGQVLLGSDYPFDMGLDDPIGELAALSGITVSERDAMAGATAARLLGLDGGGVLPSGTSTHTQMGRSA